MRMSSNTIQAQDTIPQTNAIIPGSNGLNGTVEVNPQSTEPGAVMLIGSDTSKVVLKKSIPVIKTIPQITINDSIAHPIYNVSTKKFDFPQEKSLFDGFYFMPFEPQNPISRAKLPYRQTMPNDSLIIGKEDPLAAKIALSKRENNQIGFGNTDWMIGIILFSLFLFGWLRFGFGKFVNLAMQISFSYFAARRITEEANVLRNRVFEFMNILFFINISLFIAQWISFNHFTVPLVNGITLFLAILVAVSAIYFFKGLILRLLDFLFLTKGLFAYYYSTVFIYNRMVGLLLLPLISFIPFINRNTSTVLFISGFVILVLFYGLRIFRGLQIGLKNRLSIFYLILYLCGLEFLPIMVVYKLILTQL